MPICLLNLYLIKLRIRKFCSHVRTSKTHGRKGLLLLMITDNNADSMVLVQGYVSQAIVYPSYRLPQTTDTRYVQNLENNFGILYTLSHYFRYFFLDMCLSLTTLIIIGICFQHSCYSLTRKPS